MRRIDYLPSWSERHAGIVLPPLARELHAPLAALAASFALAGVMWGVQTSRLHAAERDGAAYAERLASVQLDAARVHAVERAVRRLRSLDERVDEVRRSGTLSANAIGAVGNALPADAWLSSLRADRGTLAIEGRAARLVAVGSTIAALGALPTYGTARLLGVHDDPVRSGVTYAVTLEPGR